MNVTGIKSTKIREIYNICMISSNNERELKRSIEHSKYKPIKYVQINGTKSTLNLKTLT